VVDLLVEEVVAYTLTSNPVGAENSVAAVDLVFSPGLGQGEFGI
jgi:hypothetical protein